MLKEMLKTPEIVRIPRELCIVRYPDSSLSKISSSVVMDVANKDVQALIDDMLLTMRNYRASGLSAVQVGVPYRIMVMNDGRIADMDATGRIKAFQTELVFINPTLDNFSGNSFKKEGCLSFPGVFECIERSAEVTISGLDRNGKSVSYNLVDTMARVAQHEVDHLFGVTFLDRMSIFKRQTVGRKMAIFMRKMA